MNRKRNSKILTIMVGIMAMIFILPLLLTITNSFMGEAEIIHSYGKLMEGYGDHINGHYAALKLIPDEVTLKQYYHVLIRQNKYLLMFWNSVFLVVPIVAGQILVASMAAYAFSMIKFRWKEPIFFIYIAAMLMPFQVSLVPNYLVADWLGLIDKFKAIIFPGIFSTFGVFLMRQFMMHIPKDYIEAAQIDGAGHFSIFFKIVLPLCKNGIAALAILVFIDYWNMVEQPLIMLKDTAKYPLSLYLSQIHMNEMGIAFAASVIYMLPVLLFFLYAENYFIEGIQHSGIK